MNIYAFGWALTFNILFKLYIPSLFLFFVGNSSKMDELVMAFIFSHIWQIVWNDLVIFWVIFFSFGRLLPVGGLLCKCIHGSVTDDVKRPGIKLNNCSTNIGIQFFLFGILYMFVCVTAEGDFGNKKLKKKKCNSKIEFLLANFCFKYFKFSIIHHSDRYNFNEHTFMDMDISSEIFCTQNYLISPSKRQIGYIFSHKTINYT